MVTMFADLGSRMRLPRVALFRTTTREWVFDSHPGARRPAVEWVDESTPWVGVLGSDVFAVESETVPDLLVELASRLQRHVIDATGEQWPEVYRDGEFAGCAKPVVACQGGTGWSVLGAAPVPFGTLSAA